VNIVWDKIYDEFEKALSKLMNGKATCTDSILSKILKAVGGRTDQHELFEICSDIHRKGHWPRDFTEFIIIPIENKSGPKYVQISGQSV